MDFTVESTQSEEAWFSDLVDLIIASEPSSLPPAQQKIGSTNIEWFEIEPGIANILSTGGTIEDKYLAYCVVRAQLNGHGYTLSQYEMDRDPSEKIDMLENEEINPDFHLASVRLGTWSDVMAKAKRLLQSGAVQMLRNGANNIVSQVQGDHGSYQCEIGRDDPNSKAATQMNCECPWWSFSTGRTRQFKKFEQRPCSHLLSTWWKSQGTPLDDEYNPQTPQNPVQPTPFNQPPGQSAPVGPGGFDSAPPPTGPDGGQPSIEQLQGMPSATAPVPGQPQLPPGNEILPPWPMDPALNTPVNPISVPGLKQPSPLNPVQYPGGTFSSYNGWGYGEPDTIQVVSNDPWANGNLVSLRYDDVGTALGRSEEHGAGQQMAIPGGSVGEILGTDPTTKMINVLYSGPCKNNGPMEPFGVSAFHFPSEVVLRPELRPPGPAVRRRR
jgi:hypothetical protein